MSPLGPLGRDPHPLPGLARKRALARAALWFEQVWPAIWPALGLLGVFAIVALLDLPVWLPPWLRMALPVGAFLAAAILLARGWRRVARPGADAADRRLERASGLRHRPLATLADQPAAATAEGTWLWAMHQQRLRAQLGRLRIGVPRPGLAALDGSALRFLVGLGLVASIVMAGPEALHRLAIAIWPGLPAGAAAPGTLVQAWMTPPAYTGQAPVFLQPGASAAPVPAGAHLTVSVTGGHGSPTLTFGDEATPFHALDAASWQAERDIEQSGRLVVRRDGEEVGSWLLAVVADKPPFVSFTEPPGQLLVEGRPTPRTRLAWKAEDDYGVASVQAELRLHDRPDAPPLVLNAPLPGSPKQAHGAVAQDLTAHPWAGLPVTARMVARDTPGQRGQSDEAAFVLPERAFTNPAAQAVIAIRKQLSRTPDERRAAQTALDAVAARPELFDNAPAVALNLNAVGALLQRGRGQPAVDEAQARLWALALALEEGAAERTAQALAQARQEMRDAMQTARQNPDDPNAKSELDQKMQALREAIQKHIAALAEQARREGTQTPLDPSQPKMTARQLDQMAQRMEQAAKDGRMDDAQQQMAELEKLLEQLQNARPEHGEQRQQQNAQRRQQGKQQMDAVQDMVQREGGLLDRTRGRNDPAAPPPAPPGDREPGPDQAQTQGALPGKGQQPPDAAASPRARDQRAQQAMRRALGELMQRFGDLTGKVPTPLGEADQAMRDAGQAMADGRDDAAGAAQQKAIEALQKGGKAMGQQLSEQRGRGGQNGEGDGEDGQEMGDGDPGQPGGGENATGNRDGQPGGPQPGEASRRRNARRDPLGRPLPQDLEGREQGTDGEGLGSLPIPTEMEQARARALQDELRRRGADRTRPQPELDYIDRLLKSF